MSWVTNVILLYGVGEEWVEAGDEGQEEVEYVGPSPCLAAVNGWLRGHGRVELVDLTAHAGGPERHGFEASVWGAAVNHLDIGGFFRCVRGQPWREPQNVQVLIQDQEDERFTLLHLGDDIEPYLTGGAA